MTHAHQPHSRRGFLLTNGFVLAAGAGLLFAPRVRAQPASGKPAGTGTWPGFPQQDPALVREMVGASHGNVARVKELLKAHPELARAAIDWGFGDWETALGAASHVGNKEIAELLLANGARLDIFAAAMLGWTAVVKQILTIKPELVKTRGPHSIPLVAHAENGKHQPTVDYINSVPGGENRSMPDAPKAELIEMYSGAYAGQDGQPGVTLTKSQFGLAIKADSPGAASRLLFPTGEHTFHPAGAENVKVTITVVDKKATRVEIVEDTWFVSAVRAG